METMDYTSVNIALLGYALALTFMLIASAGQQPVPKKRKMLIWSSWLQVASLLGSLVTRLASGRPGAAMHALMWASTTVGYVFGVLTCLSIMTYVYTDVSGKLPDEPDSVHLVRLLWAINIINLAIILTNGLTHAFWEVTIDNQKVFGPLVWVNAALTLAQPVLLIPVTIRARQRNGGQTTRRYVLCGLLSLVAVLLNIALPRLALLYPVVTLVLVILYVGVQARIEEDLAEARADAAESRMRLLAGQIHPHFIFNSLNAIKALVVEDPPLAERTIQDFSDYLRSHLDEMSSVRLVPFGHEIEHVRHYVALEMADFDRALEVTYDLQVEDFLVPPLTVQPLVENAIRHGIRTREEGGHVVVRSREEDGAVLVSVTDDGRGLSSATRRQDQRWRVGIQNVRERLERQCAGTLEVTSDTEGTVATIRLPRGDGR